MGSDRAKGRESGFTLLEMLVALSVISIAALALIRLDAYAVRTAGDLDESTMAGIVAQNRAVELWTDPAPPTIGNNVIGVANAGRNWRVEQRNWPGNVRFSAGNGQGAARILFDRVGISPTPQAVVLTGGDAREIVRVSATGEVGRGQ